LGTGRIAGAILNDLALSGRFAVLRSTHQGSLISGGAGASVLTRPTARADLASFDRFAFIRGKKEFPTKAPMLSVPRHCCIWGHGWTAKAFG